MRTEELNYDLPSELIAQKPASERTESRLLVLSRADGSLKDKIFSDITSFLKPGDCLVLNDTKVLPAKFFARRQSGAKLEGLFIEQTPNGLWLIMLKNANRVKPGEKINLLDKDANKYTSATVCEKLGKGKWLLNPDSVAEAEDVLEKIGFSPLPPYIKRADPKSTHEMDKDRYQTVYAAQTGAVAAPTAGMHFSDELLDMLGNNGIKIARLTLHVGIGTFKPVETNSLDKHEIHSEKYCLDETNAAIINEAVAASGRIIAVGTTSVRTLETIAAERKVVAASGDTRLFITPGYKFKIVDCMITNFHLPKSTLIALVGAFAGLDKIMAAYTYAIEKKYRFYSYGDAMLII
ncbi:MAG: tRNA preQ1(34) S-adenosylmethionine ribosyltransferase-isomerase QueA [Anaerohalosphaeraceae bacterium]|nr:tRNA preQ1(34) S-adenosylmethionine ribosyltransferase-isomerase QueA [Anaerohalosphaeraceae bacterium]